MKVVLAIDGSPQSFSAAKLLANLPFPQQPECVVVTALLDEQSDLTKSEAKLRDKEKEDAVLAFEKVRAVLTPKFSQVQSIVRRQHPSQLIVDVGREIDADLIVVGSVGHSAIYRMTIGSTADYVANHARCSTLITRYPDGASEPTAVPKQVIIAHDGSEAADIACQQLHALVWPTTSQVQAVRLLPRPNLIAEDEIYDLAGVREHELKLQELKGTYTCGFEVLVKEVEDIPSGLYGLVQDKQPDLLFIGDSGKSAFARFFLGSTSRYLLHHVTYPIWIARKKSW